MAIFSIVNSSTPFAAPTGQQAMATTYKSLVVVGNSSATTSTLTYVNPHRAYVSDLAIGTNTAPASNYMEFDLCRITLGTTPSGITTLLISSVSSAFMNTPGDAGFVLAAQINSSAEVGISGLQDAFYLGLNQQASYRWVAAPGTEIYIPAVSSGLSGFTTNGLSLRARSGAYTGTATGMLIGNEF